MKYHCSHRFFTNRIVGERGPPPSGGLGSFRFRGFPALCAKLLAERPLVLRPSQVGSVAGAAYLLNHNAGVLKASSV